MPSPQIEFFPLLAPPKHTGKLYKARTPENTDTLFGEEEAEKKCIHGLKKRWCADCIKKAREEKQATPSQPNIFDIIFPILQPPLGDNFDNYIVFPPGKKLYPFQRVGVKFLAEHDVALLADEMGLGKSIQAIVALRLLFRTKGVTSGLIVCPKSVLTDWEKKLWEWAPELMVRKIHGSKRERELAWKSQAHIYLTTYETLRNDLPQSVHDLLGALKGITDEDIAIKEHDFIILDEVQKIKNPSAGITKAVRAIKAPIRWALSGTPLENRLDELISIFAYLKPGLLKYDDAEDPVKVKQAIKPYFLRRRKKEAMPDLPPKVYGEVWLELLPAQRETYNKAEREGIIELSEKGDSVTVQHILALITKLKQICNLDPVTKQSCKLEYLKEKLAEISEEGSKALVFSQYPEKTLKFIEPEIKEFNPLFYHGSLSDSEREKIIKKFQEEEENKVLLMSVKAGGLGLTLTRANHVYHFDLWWNPSVAIQAEDRAHRIGQQQTVFVTTLFTANTIEQRIQKLLERKRHLFKEVIDDLSDTKLSQVLTEEELFSLFGLEKKKVEHKVSEQHLSQLSPQDFEKLIADLFEKMGYHIRLTPHTKDQGVDIYAKRVGEIGIEHLAIQCKHYPNRVVGVEHARALYGVIQADPTITKGLLVTSGRFSKECEEFAEGKSRIVLHDGVSVIGLLEKYGLLVGKTN